jgi:hypothetical protein
MCGEEQCTTDCARNCMLSKDALSGLDSVVSVTGR